MNFKNPQAKWSDWLLLAPLIACVLCLPQCHLDQAADRQEKYVTVHLNDSLKRFDSVDIAIVVAGDTSKEVGKMWSGKLADPASLPSYRLDDSEERALAIHVRGYDSYGKLTLDMIISKENGEQTVTDLPVPGIPVESAYKAWKYKRIVDIKLKSLELDKGSIVRGFPLLVRLQDTYFDFAQTAEGGRDIRFTTLDGRILPYEIDNWEPTAKGKAEIWVRLDTLKSDDVRAGILMYWGNVSATSESNGAKVFSPEDAHGVVLHMSETGKGAAAEFKDATGRYNGTGGGGDGKNVPIPIDGVIGLAQDFHPGTVVPAADHSTINLPSAFDPGNQKWTFQAWVRRTGKAFAIIFQKGDDWVAGKQRFQIKCVGDAGGQVYLEREGAAFITNVYLPLDQVVYLGVVYDGSWADIYLDGVLVDSDVWTQGGDPTGRAVLGAYTVNGSAGGFEGQMDEVWISSTARTDQWMLLSYETQRNYGTPIVTLRPE